MVMTTVESYREDEKRMPGHEKIPVELTNGLL